MPYAEVVEQALYDPEHGFYAVGGRAGRSGDFLTSPEVGPLFGALVAEAVDREWDRCGRPSVFTVVDAGAGPGTLARSVMAAEPRCRRALDYVAVEWSAGQRELHPPTVRSAATMPTDPMVGVVFANELLDNLPFQPLVRIDGEWRLVVVDLAGDRLVARPGPTTMPPVSETTDHYTAQEPAAVWLRSALAHLERGSVVVVDYARSSSAEVDVRTYRGHERAADPLEALGRQDITVDVDLEQLSRRVRPPDIVGDQASWLGELGIEAMVAQGRTDWAAGAAVGGLDALRARSRIREAEALSDPTGLGAFTVARWVVD